MVRNAHIHSTYATGLALLLIWIVTVSCQGPAGPIGKDARLTDSLPPTIEWIAPEPGITLDSIALLQVTARDNIGVYKVAFYVAGFEFAGVLIDSIAGKYEYRWDVSDYPEAPYPLMARAWDNSRQIGTTPVRVVNVKH